ncbi:polysaccharide biosynthesis protein (RgpF) [Streptococcus infantarius subsp. infantarius]|uniref:rhamnan synthesis F family protein n=1 Tax=Streptococcus TaxID=1301 RepID=UPI000EC18D31|nr:MULTISPECIES: rhamnan synthesis F family protein [Streptococcus]MBT0904381.1 alpha-L-Rha alpha-1,3-L-rhamnosyltransferase [Streptococcus infantarius subsp. infantarius]MBT0918294.1 alpha-L-Rha alpha-1,3-L-rhamnosyltransferase [Streptococcus infantarius subsp. infantarius]MCO4564334.1 polysaccharide biosynthesis protein (RgpF) [Streptococcus infantarius subsp. infantarius]MCO4569871.1 polysaccharide biosynthesis protein (RgpF) [Streptococcus infantarius subsp. infantarius]MCO4572562.1 polysa
MKRLLLYVHFNKYNRISSHVYYQLTKMRQIFSNVVFISNSSVSDKDYQKLVDLHLVDNFIQRENIGFDFAAWRDGMTAVGFEELATYDSVTIMNDTCFGPLWDIKDYYLEYESDDSVDFWGLTNNRATPKSRYTQGFREHIQSYFITFKKSVIVSPEFKNFWENVKNYTNVQDVIDNYETQVTTKFLDAGFNYKVIFNTVNEDASHMLHADFSFYHPTAILSHRVPFIKVKAIDNNQHITPYLLDEIAKQSDYPVDLIISHMSEINFPDFKYLLARKYVKEIPAVSLADKKIAVHLHVFYVDLLEDFLDAFENFHFVYDLFITTDNATKKQEIESILRSNGKDAQIFVTGNVGRDVLPMLKLKDYLSDYDYIGHFHTKKSKEADFWAGESWRNELIDMLIKPADNILANFDNDKLGIVIADIPTFFRFNKIVDAWNEHLIAPAMNDLWQQMGMTKAIDFNNFHNFVMSYGTYVWFKYDALKPLFDLGLTDEAVPAEPLPQNSILHAIERLLIYIAWNEHYDFRISKNPIDMTPFVDNKLYNERGDSAPHTYVDFTYMGGIKGAFKYIFIGPARAVKYIIRRSLEKVTHDRKG